MLQFDFLCKQLRLIYRKLAGRFKEALLWFYVMVLV